MRRRAIGSTVSLFPFLTILVCLMGVLSFIMVGIVVVSAANPDVAFEFVGSHKKTPTFVECHGENMIVHPERRQIPTHGMTVTGSPFLSLLDEIARHKDRRYVVVVVFPEGIDCFREARNEINSRKIDIGFEPMLEGWTLSLAAKPGDEP